MPLYLFLTGALFLVVGVRALLKPIEAVAIPFSLQADAVDARHYLRASAGGVTIACGGVILAGSLVPSIDFAALLLSVTVLGGLLFGRAVSLVLDGRPGSAPWVAAAMEAVGFLSGLFWMLRVYG